MNGRTIFGTFAILLSMIQMNCFSMSKGQPIYQTNALAKIEAAKEQILAATVEIEMTLQAPAMGGRENKLLGKGLGSLVWSEGEVLLVTHNHWGEVLRDQTVVVFYDRDRRVIKITLGKEFLRLVIYQDAGTLVLEAPEEVAGLIDPLGGKASVRTGLGESRQVKVGSTVLLAYHQRGNRGEVGLLEAKVENIAEYKALPVFVLRSLYGTPVMQGDSGGGIWHDGKLVGNMWATIVRDTGNKSLTYANNSLSVQQLTDQSFGAIFPEKVGGAVRK